TELKIFTKCPSNKLLVDLLLSLLFHVLKLTTASIAPTIASTTNTDRQPKYCSNIEPSGAPNPRAEICPETVIESHVPVRFGGAVSPIMAYMTGVIDATDKPVKIRLTINQEKVG